MVEVKIVRKTSLIRSINISGHANYAKSGNDLVCAAVSSISIGLCNAIDEMKAEGANICVEHNKVNIIVEKTSEMLNNILNVGYYQLKTIEENYPQFIKITEEQI